AIAALTSTTAKTSVARTIGTRSAISMDDIGETPLAILYRHCEPALAGAAIQQETGLLRRFAPRNDGRNERPRRPATGGARLVRSPARPDLRGVRGDRARGRVRCVLRLHAVGAHRSERRTGRRRGARPNDRRGVREGR